jgi:hypothetical protein
VLSTQLLISGNQPGTKPGPINSFTYSRVTYDSATFRWRPVTGASAYELAVYHSNPNGFSIAQIYLTKNTTATATQLIPNDSYFAYLWAFNPSGGSQSNQVNFATPKKP